MGPEWQGPWSWSASTWVRRYPLAIYYSGQGRTLAAFNIHSIEALGGGRDVLILKPYAASHTKVWMGLPQGMKEICISGKTVHAREQEGLHCVEARVSELITKFKRIEVLSSLTSYFL